MGGGIVAVIALSCLLIGAIVGVGVAMHPCMRKRLVSRTFVRMTDVGGQSTPTNLDAL